MVARDGKTAGEELEDMIRDELIRKKLFEDGEKA